MTLVSSAVVWLLHKSQFLNFPFSSKQDLCNIHLCCLQMHIYLFLVYIEEEQLWGMQWGYVLEML
jgi:hypothetical protein